ncbi:hypothetical protein IC762_12510 [Bradyrhizobium genosp. L]|uniref:hypothetical protein n=1 Tax=Bradyrhizobium genosp. L TaxID=83637 RepID=UPI0018A2C2F3|nr:hypothetical protein [Bradyrhizobium genosp. L]QPF81712.1 hypothetical protein IC762_17980 [Bradyrhizobium genosp. L]QPF87064.1 hypothetical protein IC762_12510 [Bradyrhizobium genosp. L]
MSDIDRAIIDVFAKHGLQCAWEVRRDLADALRAQLAASQPAQGGTMAVVPAVDPDLVQRCRELLDWSKTGLLNGGSGGALRTYADRLAENIGEHYALSVAEVQTKDDAMGALVKMAALVAEGDRARSTDGGAHG